MLGASGGVRGVLGAGRDCMLGASGVSRGVGLQGCIGAGRDCRYSGARRGIGASGALGS